MCQNLLYYIQLVSRHILDETMGYVPYIYINLSINQRSTDTAMHHVITHTQEAVENTEVTLWPFLDIERVFSSTPCDITKAAKLHWLGATR